MSQQCGGGLVTSDDNSQSDVFSPESRTTRSDKPSQPTSVDSEEAVLSSIEDDANNPISLEYARGILIIKLMMCFNGEIREHLIHN